MELIGLSSKKKKKRKGTYELADRTASIQKGCIYNCPYCYAKVIGNRFGWKKADDWHNPELNKKDNGTIRKKYKKPIFCFSTHDITPENVDDCIDYIINNILKTSKNNVLIVSKFNSKCMIKLCDYLKEYKDRIEFMATITTNSTILLQRFEPNAPFYRQRFGALYYANIIKGFKTSVLIEPFLGENPIPLILTLAPYCYRIILGCFSKSNMKFYNYRYHQKENLCKIIHEIKKLPKEIIYKIKLKNSFRDRLKII
jgi:DNA repair photolyase